MKRREFITLLGGAAAAWPVIVRAQQPKVMRIAVLMGVAENDPEGQARVAAFRQGLHDLKWEEGRNVRVDIRWGAGDASRIKAYASELVNLAPDVILATNTPTARALKQATETIPIVFAGLTDPVGDGVVKSLSRPAGNITGFTSFNAETAGNEAPHAKAGGATHRTSPDETWQSHYVYLRFASPVILRKTVAWWPTDPIFRISFEKPLHIPIEFLKVKSLAIFQCRTRLNSSWRSTSRPRRRLASRCRRRFSPAPTR